MSTRRQPLTDEQRLRVALRRAVANWRQARRNAREDVAATGKTGCRMGDFSAPRLMAEIAADGPVARAESI